MEIEKITGLDLPQGEWVWQVTKASGRVHYHRTRIERLPPPPDRADISENVKITVWECDEAGEAILNSVDQPKGLVSHVRSMMKEAVDAEKISFQGQLADLISEQIQRCRNNCAAEDGILARLPTAS